MGQEFWEPEHVLSLAKSLGDLKVPSFVIYRFLAAQSLLARLPITSQKRKDLLSPGLCWSVSFSAASFSEFSRTQTNP